MSPSEPVIHSDPEILSGIPVFVGTRVPVKNLFDYLARGAGLEAFSDDFPSVTPAQAIAALGLAGEMLDAHAHSHRRMPPEGPLAAPEGA